MFDIIQLSANITIRARYQYFETICVLTINSNAWNHLIMSKQINSDLFENNLSYKLFVYKYIYN